MSKFLLEDCYVEIDGVDLSDHAFNIDTPSERERVEVSGFNPNGNREFLAGLREDSVTVQFLQDFAASEVHATLWPIYNTRDTVYLRVRPTSSAASATNPELHGNVQLLSYNGLSGALNERSEMSVTFTPADGEGLIWENDS